MLVPKQYAAVIIAVIFFIGWKVVEPRLKESRQVHAVPILMYHKIGAVTDNAWWVPADVFEGQLRALRNEGFSTILPGDLVAHRRTGRRLPPKPLIITFDDGYRDTLAIAEPLLKRYGFRAVAYLITDAVAETTEQRRRYDGMDIVTWPEIKEMQQRRTFIFGGHGHQHLNLETVDDPYPDIRECFLQLRRHGIRHRFSFCYPFGQVDERVIAAAKRAGFLNAMVCEDRVAMTGKAMKLLALPRVSVMGGRHEFSVQRLSESAAPGEVVVLVTHTGIPMEVSPCLVWSGAETPEAWLPPVEIASGQYEWRWPRPTKDSRAAPARLEIWDKHRLFPMAMEEL